MADITLPNNLANTRHDHISPDSHACIYEPLTTGRLTF